MRKSLFLLLAGAACSGAGSAWAQTPAPGLMPDGSYDMYAGLGVRSAPNYEGGADRRLRAMPALQIGWSNGAFISGMSAGLHLSSTPRVEYGPLLSLHPGRSQNGSSVLDAPATLTATGDKDNVLVRPGTDNGATWVDWAAVVANPGQDSLLLPPGLATGKGMQVNVSYRLRNIGARPEAGFFFNYYLTDRLRLTNSVLYGAAQDRRGLRWTADLQRGAIELGPHHTLSLAVGATLANRAYNTGYFGLRSDDVLQVMPVVMALESKAPAAAPVWAYAPGGGIKDVHASARWNWALSPSWLLTTNVQVTQLRGGAKNSLLTDRATGVTVSTALAYRF